jgi:recombination protein RecR
MVSDYLDALVREFSRIPGMGPKSASRAAFHVLSMKRDDVERFSRALLAVKDHIRDCALCGGIADVEICPICADSNRDRSLICVVEDRRDVLTIERTRAFRGLYHVLGGVIAPLDGVGPDDLRIAELLNRCDGSVREVVIATNPTLEGDATALYITAELKKRGVRVMRISRGLPVGGDLEFSDSATVARSIDERVEI